MKIIKEIFGRIWALWALIFFASTMFIALVFYLPCFIMKEPFAARWHRAVSRVWMTAFIYAIGCPLKIKGRQHFEKGKNYIVVCNHNSLMDVPITTPFMPHANKTIAKKEFAKIPFFGWIYSLGSVLVDRKDEQSRGQSYDKMKKILSVGLDMVIYPEGTRNRTHNPLKPFYDGAFKLAVDTGKPVMPAVIFNTKKILPANKFFYLMPHKIEMHFLHTVSPANISVKELKEKVFKIMWDYYVQNQ